MIHEFYAFMNLWRDAILTKQAQFITIFHSQKLASFFFPYRHCSEQLPWWSQIMPWLGKFHFIQWDFWTLRGKTCWIFYLSWVWYTSFLYKTYMCVWGIHGRLSMQFFFSRKYSLISCFLVNSHLPPHVARCALLHRIIWKMYQNIRQNS